VGQIGNFAADETGLFGGRKPIYQTAAGIRLLISCESRVGSNKLVLFRNNLDIKSAGPDAIRPLSAIEIFSGN
jgi:hypothetical protein